MKTIVIERKEMTTYSVVYQATDEEAEIILNANKDALERLCRANVNNWQDAEEPEFKVFEEK